VKASAFAKINLGLEVLYRRDDGYHEIRTIFQTVDLWDVLSFEATAGERLSFSCDDPALPTGEDNLVVRAAEALARRTGRRQGVAIHLEKKIPVGAGLGGGSSDAAATLLALNELWSAGLPLSALHDLARRLGADVPFFLYGGTALGIGRGDEVFPLAREVRLPIVLVLPDAPLSTASVYRSLVLTKRESTLKLQYFPSSVWDGEDSLFSISNDLESAAVRLLPSIDGFKQSLRELGACATAMSGSGSTVFGLFLSSATAESAALTLTARGDCAVATRTIVREEYLERRLNSRKGPGKTI